MEAAATLRAPCAERLFQGVENKVRAHRTACTPADNASGKHVDDEGYVSPFLPGRDVSEIRYRELVRPLGMKLSFDPVQRARRSGVAHRHARPLPNITPSLVADAGS